MKTACYSTYRGPGRIGISIGNPRGIPAGYRMYKALAPRRDMLQLGQAEYREFFFRDILGLLDPAQVVRDLENLVASAEPVLMCFEKPPFTPVNFCHRRMVADWLKDTLGLNVPEYEKPHTRDLFS